MCGSKAVLSGDWVVDVSIFIPVYKESNQLSPMLEELTSQDVTKEIFVIIDEPTQDFLEKLKPLQNKGAKFIINEKRIGKANALNSTVKLSTGKMLLFLDADIQISSDPDFLKKIIMELQHSDIIDIKKRVTKDKSFLSRMAYYEYFTFNVSSWLHQSSCTSAQQLMAPHLRLNGKLLKRLEAFTELWQKTLILQQELFCRTALSPTAQM